MTNAPFNLTLLRTWLVAATTTEKEITPPAVTGAESVGDLRTVLIYNAGSNPVLVGRGPTGTTLTAPVADTSYGDMLLPAGVVATFSMPVKSNKVIVKTTTSTSNVYVTFGNGN